MSKKDVPLLGSVIKLSIFAPEKSPPPFEKIKVAGIFDGLHAVQAAKTAWIYSPMARYRKVMICPRVQVALGLNVVSLVPSVIS